MGLDDFSAEDCSGELVWCELRSELSQLSSGLETPALPSTTAAACPASEKPCCFLAVILGHPAQYKTSHRQHTAGRLCLQRGLQHTDRAAH